MASTGKFHHRVNKSYGENLYAGSDSDKAVKTWYNEKNKYDYSRPGFSSATGHFTQLVWKSSKKIGIGMASSSGMTYVVANFYPAGNYISQFEENVS
uniref:SCP domain-containing protein n=1 Tax=Syphacia muris TaxID=451379 RepID=A0A0N5ALB9_9BILA